MIASNSKSVKKINERKIRNICEEMTAIYEFIDREMKEGKLDVPWRDDSEKFIALNFGAIDTLNKHSRNLTILTIALLIVGVLNLAMYLVPIFC